MKKNLKMMTMAGMLVVGSLSVLANEDCQKHTPACMPAEPPRMPTAECDAQAACAIACDCPTAPDPAQCEHDADAGILKCYGKIIVTY
jgi:hypothetical protein